MLRFGSLFLALAFSSALAAQTRVCVTGKVVPVTGPTICQQGETHMLECTRVFLRSNTVNLGTLVNRTVRLEGVDVGVTCRVIQVLNVTRPRAELQVCGTPRAGCPMKLKICPGGLGWGTIGASFAPGYRPLGCGNAIAGFDGTLLLGGPITILWTGGLGAGCGEVTITIPNLPGLVGADFWIQGGRQDIGPVGPFALSDTRCFRILPPGGPCVLPGC